MEKRMNNISLAIKNYYSYMNQIVTMPDFFLDRILLLQSQDEFFQSIVNKIRVGGGSIREILTVDRKGGNAANIAYSIAKLGGRVAFFTVGDQIARSVIETTFQIFGEKVEIIISDGIQGKTTSMELYDNVEGKSKVNVMLSDVGDNADFGKARINSETHLKILNKADAVIVANWASNLKGTELMKFAFESSPKALHFVDPADFQLRKEEFIEILALLSNQIDVLSINENECNTLGSSLGLGTLLPWQSYSRQEIKDAALKLSKKIGLSIDIHTKLGSAWSNGKDSEIVPAIRSEIRTLTGAGDVWEAADVVAYLAGLDPIDRLTFANAASSLYVRNQSAESPSLEEVVELLDRINM
ncbi:MAG: carbohydrate kinase family protein [Nitrososphaeraceae archaeon]